MLVYTTIITRRFALCKAACVLCLPYFASDWFSPLEFAGDVELSIIGFGTFLKGTMFENQIFVLVVLFLLLLQINASLL